MSRHKPQVIMYDQHKDVVFEICLADGCWAVAHQGKLIKIRKIHGDYVLKYGKVTFPEPGHAIALAKRLNKRFNTEDFTVVQLVSK